MEKHTRVKQLLIFALLCALLFSNLPFAYTALRHEITGAAEARDGRIDLSQENLASEKIYLDGEWKFYWDHFLGTEATANPIADLKISVPDEWSGYTIDGHALPAGGHATYKLTMKGIDYNKPVTVFVPDFGSAYRVFIDGEMTAESGTLSKNKKDIFTSPKADLYPVTLSAADTHVILIEVATSRFSGLYMTPILADYEAIKAKHETRDAFRLILFGVAVFSLLSLIALYAFAVKKNLNSLWLPLMVFLIVLRVMLTSEFYSMWQGILFFDLSYEKTNELMYLSSFALKYLLLFLVDEHCGIKIGKKAKTAFLAYYVGLYLVYLLLPSETYNHGFSVLVPLLTYALDLYLYIKVYRNRNELKKFGLPIFFCSILIGVGLAVDSYYINGKIAADMSLALLFTFTICSLIICWVYAMRAADLYDDFARSDSQFKLLQKQLAMQKEYYSTLSGQMNEIREMKHDIRHFVGTMGRLTEEGKIDELKSFINEYDNKTKTEELPFFCKNIVVNSLIGYYYLRAKEYGIRFESHCNVEEDSVMSDSDYCIVIGNALENALHACIEIQDTSLRRISIEVALNKRQRLIKVKNSYSGTLEINDGQFVSNKRGKSHGLGLQNIKNIVEAYDGFVIIEHDEKEFRLLASVLEV